MCMAFISNHTDSNEENDSDLSVFETRWGWNSGNVSPKKDFSVNYMANSFMYGKSMYAA